MLLQLEISNIALIDYLNIEFKEGMNVLTGETGAGKSIIIDSISAILGGRMPREIIRTGRDSAQVTAIFQIHNQNLDQLLKESGIIPEDDGTLIIFREFNNQGRNLCRVNNKIVTVSFLKEISPFLIDIHGQHDNQSLLRTENHIMLLDSFAAPDLQVLNEEYKACLEEYKNIGKELRALYGDEGERERRIDLLKFQINEINEANLKLQEDEELESRKNILQSAEKISAALNLAYEMLYSGDGGDSDGIMMSAYDNINSAAKEIESISNLKDDYNNILSRINGIGYELEDIARDIRENLDEIEYDPYEIEQIEERLDLIFKLKRKYGNNIEEILSFRDDAEKELDMLENNKSYAADLEKRREKCTNKLIDLSEKMSAVRKEAAAVLESGILKHLQDLEMKNASFKVNFERLDNFLSNGIDKVEFLVSANAGEPVKPLAKIASGGEMSRIMLAIKTMLADVDNVPTLIFDEIDTGISGIAAQKVAEKMMRISENHQVICVTHLAQIAVAANHNLFIEKTTQDNMTTTSVKALYGDDLINEIARILDGDRVSSIARAHAEEMLKNAKKR